MEYVNVLQAAEAALDLAAEDAAVDCNELRATACSLFILLVLVPAESAFLNHCAAPRHRTQSQLGAAVCERVFEEQLRASMAASLQAQQFSSELRCRRQVGRMRAGMANALQQTGTDVKFED